MTNGLPGYVPLSQVMTRACNLSAQRTALRFSVTVLCETVHGQMGPERDSVSKGVNQPLSN